MPTNYPEIINIIIIYKDSISPYSYTLNIIISIMVCSGVMSMIYMALNGSSLLAY